MTWQKSNLMKLPIKSITKPGNYRNQEDAKKNMLSFACLIRYVYSFDGKPLNWNKASRNVSYWTQYQSFSRLSSNCFADKADKIKRSIERLERDRRRPLEKVVLNCPDKFTKFLQRYTIPNGDSCFSMLLLFLLLLFVNLTKNRSQSRW